MDKLKKILSKILNVDVSQITDEFSRNTCEDWDSFNHLLLISEIEHEIGIRIDFQDIESIKSFADLKRVIIAKRNELGEVNEQNKKL